MDKVKKKIQKQDKNKKDKQSIKPEEEVKKNIDEMTPEEQMQTLFGFSNFTSTKEKSHEDTNVEGVRKNKKMKRKFRQYMNRRGGFNKPLDSI